ncbi:MAG: STAS domain-containing protein [Actinomadura sp.]
MSVNATRECAPARITSITRDATGATRVAVAGELDIASATDFAIELAGLIEERGPDIVVDVSGLTFCDARGLAAFVAADGRARSRGGSVTLTGVRSQLAKILHVTRLDERFMRPRAAGWTGADRGGPGTGNPRRPGSLRPALKPWSRPPEGTRAPVRVAVGDGDRRLGPVRPRPRPGRGRGRAVT